MFNAKPVGKTYYSAKITWVLHIIKCYAQIILCHISYMSLILRLAKDGKHLLWRLKETDLAKFILSHSINGTV